MGIKFTISKLSYFCMAAILLATVVSCKGEAEKSVAAAPQAMPLPVTTIQKGDITLYSDFAAEIVNEEFVQIKSRSNGYIEKIYVEEGASVKRGQLIMTIDQREYVQRVNAANATVEMCKAQVSNAALEVEKVTPLVEKGIVSDFQLKSAKAALQSAQAQQIQAQSQLTDAKIQLSYTRITSPMSGVIGTIDIFPGSLVSAGTPITTVTENSDAVAYFAFDEKKVLTLADKFGSIGAAVDSIKGAQLILSDGSLYPFEGKVEVASSIVNKATGSIQLKATFENPTLSLRSGATGKVRLPQHHNGVLLVPQKATFELQDKKMVYTVAADSTLKCAILTTVGSVGDNYAVNSGVAEGDVIITEGINRVKEGAKISPVNK